MTAPHATLFLATVLLYVQFFTAHPAAVRILVGLKLAPPTAADVHLLADLSVGGSSHTGRPRDFLNLTDARSRVRLVDESCRDRVPLAIEQITKTHGGRRLTELPGGHYASYALTVLAMSKLFPGEVFNTFTAVAETAAGRRNLQRANPERDLIRYLHPRLRACVGYITTFDQHGIALVDETAAGMHGATSTGNRPAPPARRRASSASDVACNLGRPFACNMTGNHQCDAGVDAKEECHR
jgi:hypothetical protein